MSPQDELTATLSGAVETLSRERKADLLLETSLALIQSGRYGDEVETYLDVYLRTPGLPKADITRALLARADARMHAGEKLVSRAHQDLLAAARLDPTVTTHRALKQCTSIYKRIHFVCEPASRRAPTEIWELIASFIPRFHLRTWLFVSVFYRDIAARLIFQTVDLYFGEDQENVNRGLDVLDRVKADPIFAHRVRTLRLHWAYEESDMLDLMLRLFSSALPYFKALRAFEWIGYPEMRYDMVQALLASHPHLESLNLVGWHFDAVGVSSFSSLRRFCLRAEDDDGFADMGEVRSVLDHNPGTLRHLTLGADLQRAHSWDSAFESTTVQRLTHLDLVDTRISHTLLMRIIHLNALRALTLHGTLAEPATTRIVFDSDRLIGGSHVLLPRLEAFRFVMVGHDHEWGLYQAVAHFVTNRPALRRLDLCSCPWELVRGVLPGLTGLRVLRVHFDSLCQDTLAELVRSVPEQMVALHVSSVVSTTKLHEYAPAFRRFHSLSMLHLRSHWSYRPHANSLSTRELSLQTDNWLSSARSIAIALPSLDFVGWHGEHFVVTRSSGGTTKKEAGEPSTCVEIKELPARRRLDCGKGVNLGSEDATWLERRDVPMDYDRAESELLPTC